MNSQMTIGISIATHNRLPELRRTLQVLAKLLPAPDEMLICADGCDDGTVEFLRHNYPGVRLIEHARPHGSIRSRIELIKAATADVLVSLDDDSYPVEADFIAQVRSLFEERPWVAVGSFAQRTDEFPATLDATDLGPSGYTANYVNAAAAFRRSVYLELGGWPPEFEHAYDEPDYTLQCLAAGHAVYHDSSIVIRHHFTSLKRNEIRTHQRHARNELWSIWLRCPFPLLMPLAPYRALTQLGYAMKRGSAWVVREPAWWLRAMRGLPLCLRKRRPVPVDVYLKWLRMIRNPIATTEEWRAAFEGKRP